MTKSPRKTIFGVLLPVAVLTLLIAPWVGISSPDWSVIARPGAEDLDALVFWQIRVPRVLLAMLAGIGLSLGGVVFQAIFRNPLATPFTLGVAGGASLGVTLSLFLGIQFTFLGVSGLSLAALLGAIVSIALVYGVAKATGNTSPQTMLLGGVAISFFFSSLILLFQYLGDLSNTFRIIHWLMGDLSRASYDTVFQVLPFIFSGSLIIAYLHRELNLLTIDDDLAASYGLRVEPMRFTLFIAVSLMIAGIVTVCGPIGFVGIMAPHICRLLIGTNHRHLIPASILFGGSFLTLCDTIARTLATSAEVPVGIITALLGGPFFLWLLFRSGR
ncbi:iron ABC transporter permease [Verrucomicrobiaceae bacterium 5K15]|uniref:Iron ABC transporter permease n=1 Tax=Oceaniferula flava TaxID=2800421 RepID=A0AAE2S9Z8_9BACT|nr:iron ABC transporter permease [Oceaniferula flavus]MBK1854165.1 iron ABC transporter permease [Oceaniferula flavus]MBM1135471.1 iron ABC transporter permease [Oceaniferula flavus]